MRSGALVVILSLATTLAALGLAPPATAQPAPPRMALQVYGETVGGAFVFTPSQILIPQVPIVLNITFVNNETVASGMIHSFTINDNGGVVVVINSGLLQPQQNVSLEFTVVALDQVLFGNATFAPEPTASGRGILYYCIPHRGVGMIGEIVLATAPAPPTDLGVVIRAYWIGIIAIIAMVGWIGISYFVVKSSSRRFTDHKEHVRKGLP